MSGDEIRTTDAFGRPLSEADQRFYALRESGYRGPIDQDGNAQTSGWMSDILRDMAKARGEEVDW